MFPRVQMGIPVKENSEMKAKVILIAHGRLPEFANVVQGETEEQIKQKLPMVLKKVYEDEKGANGNISCSSEEFQRSVIENGSFVQGEPSNLEIFIIEAEMF